VGTKTTTPDKNHRQIVLIMIEQLASSIWQQVYQKDGGEWEELSKLCRRLRLAPKHPFHYSIVGCYAAIFRIYTGGMETSAMIINTELLAILCCPETKQPVTMADQSLVDKLNAAVARGSLKNKGQKPVSEPLDGGLVRADLKILYPIRENIPIMLIEEAIALDQVS
jgi:uncharacterized protein YbaR (Trm112 family)